MIRLTDRTTAQYRHVCDTCPAATGLGGGRFSVYLGILSPAALARVGMSRGDEAMGDNSAYVATLFNGALCGTGIVAGDTAPALSSRLKAAVGAGVPLDTDDAFRRVLLALRLTRDAQCLAFVLTVTDAGALGIGLPPTLRVLQNGTPVRRGSFAPMRPARIVFRCGSTQRELRVLVGGS